MDFRNIFKRSVEPVTDNWQLLEAMLGGGQTNSGNTVNSKTAQALPAIYCAVSTIAEAIAAMPIHVYRKVNGNDRERAGGHNVERLLNQAPNEYQTPYDFKMALMRSALLKGNSYTRIIYDGVGKAKSLHFIHPEAIQVKWLKSGRLGYLLTEQNGKKTPLHQEEVIHIRYHSDDGIIGKSPVTVCRESIGLGLAQQEHGAKHFKNGATPSSVLEYDKFLSEKNVTKLRKDFDGRYQGIGNGGQTMILEGGLKWRPIGLSNQDSEWLESRQFTVADIARMFKISPIYLMDYSNSTYSNHSEASRAFLSQTLRPWLSNIEQAFTSRLITSRNQGNIYIEFQTTDALRATTKDRYEIYDIAIRNGLMNPNECRKAENLPSREGGDDYSQSWNQQQNEEQHADS